MSKLRPVNGNVIIRPIEEEEQMSGNIIIPDMGKERPEMGEIVAISGLSLPISGIIILPDICSSSEIRD